MISQGFAQVSELLTVSDMAPSILVPTIMKSGMEETTAVVAESSTSSVDEPSTSATMNLQAHDLVTPAETPQPGKKHKRKDTKTAETAETNTIATTIAATVEDTIVTTTAFVDSPSHTVDKENVATPVSASKKSKKEKDPNAPKRPLNAYFLYQRDHRAMLKTMHPEMMPSEVVRRLCEDWDKATPELKSRYEQQARALFDVYNRDMDEYKLAKTAMVESPVVAEPTVVTVEKPAEGESSVVSVAIEPCNTPSIEECNTPSIDTPSKEKKRKEKKRPLETTIAPMTELVSSPVTSITETLTADLAESKKKKKKKEKQSSNGGADQMLAVN